MDAPPLDRTVLSRLDEQDEDHDEDDPLDSSVRKDSEIANDRLSKRLSGGHYGSAGGLIMSTLSIPKDDDPQDPERVCKGDTHVESKEQNVMSETEPVTIEEPLATNEVALKNKKDLVQTEREISQCDRENEGEETEEENEGDEEDTHVSELTDQSSEHAPSINDMVTPPPTSSAPTSIADEADDAVTFVGDPNDDEDEQIADYAKRIWEQDDTVYTSMEHIAEWIGNG